MSIHTEINFENAICEHLANHGWLYADGDASRYDRARTLFPDDVLAWLQESQSDAWDAAAKSHGANAGDVGRYVVANKNKKKQIESYIFPRYHQLDVTRKLQSAVLSEGPGQKDLIQHSDGSGKTNSIAWSAHFLADLHCREPQRASGGFLQDNPVKG